jgi:hypothetical protein
MAVSVYDRIDNITIFEYELNEGLVRPNWIDAKYIIKGDYIAHTIPDDSCTVDHPTLTLEMCKMYGKLLLHVQDYASTYRNEFMREHPSKFVPENHFFVVNTYKHISPIRKWLESQCILPFIHCYTSLKSPEEKSGFDNSHWDVDENTVVLLGWPKSCNLPFRMTDFWKPNTEQSHISERWMFLPKPKIEALVNAYEEELQSLNTTIQKNQERRQKIFRWAMRGSVWKAKK